YTCGHVTTDPNQTAVNVSPEAFTEGREFQTPPRWNLGMDAARHQTVAFELAQCLRQHFVTDFADPPLQVGKSQLAFAVQGFDHEQRPFIRDPLQDFVQQCLFLWREVANCGRLLRHWSPPCPSLRWWISRQ